MESLNLPPFYVGQKVVSLKSGKALKKDEVVIVSALFKCECGEWHVQWGCPHGFESNILYDCECDRNITYMVPYMAHWGRNARFFAPLQEQTYPLISLTKVVEENRELVSAN